MGKFSVRLDDKTEKLLSGIMKQERYKTKNTCIESIIKEHAQLKNHLQQKIRELNTISRDYDHVYYLLERKTNIDNEINKIFGSKKKKKGYVDDFLEEE